MVDVLIMKSTGHPMNIVHNMQQNQLTRSLERILEDAHLSGELKLSGRKLKDFPKAAGKYNLSDTVIADLSRNRFCELPDDVTSFPFLETLLVYHNTLRSIPDTVRGLHSLSYLDLRSNQLSVLPREICLLPLQVLLVSNNRLVSLPEELGRMDHLTELDAACNQITHLPARMSDLKSLKSLSLRSNQLVYLPRELTCLNLVSLDISCNRIATLPVELRLMVSLVNLELESNPLTSPPASLCVRGLVHVFKYLDTIATKEEKTRAGGSFDGHTTLRRTIQAKPIIDSQKVARRVDSGYSTSDGVDRRWSQEIPSAHTVSALANNDAKWSPTPLHIRTTENGGSDATPSMSPAGSNNATTTYDVDEEFKLKRTLNNGSHSNSNEESPDGDFAIDQQYYCNKSDDKLKQLGNVQTYREYKEALRQQRTQDSTAVYRTKDHNSPSDGNSNSSIESPSSCKSQTASTPSPTVFSSSSSPLSPSQNAKSSKMETNGQHNNNNLNNSNTKIPNNSSSDESLATAASTTTNNKKPIQKVTPSRNAAYQSPTHWTVNGNHKTVEITTTVTKEYSVYVKPNSPTRSPSIVGYNNVPATGGQQLSSTTSMKNGTNKVGPKQNRSVSWNRDIPAEKLSFTMRREFDKQKEESELIEQLRKIIESRLKMALPSDVASALTDGVVLCHLANHVRPRSVASIHVPSPAVPKLTMARCRRNVDNFLSACRTIGVDENLMCCAADVLEGKGAVQVAITVTELLRFHNAKSITSPIKSTNGSAASSLSPTSASSSIA